MAIGLDKQKHADALNRLLEVMDTLRKECPWDSVQTWRSIRPNSIEEMFELLDAIERDDTNEIKKEIGDVLLQLVFYSLFAREEDRFDLADAINALSDKLIYRHPHVYGQKEAGKQLTWEQLKQKEKDGNKTVLGGVPASLPSLIKAYRIQDKARNVGFVRASKHELITSIIERLQKLDAIENEDKNPEIEADWGSILFDVIGATRLGNANPENGLEAECEKFTSRFNKLEEAVKSSKKDIKDLTQEELKSIWEQSK
ncbi:MAG: nucleoside triphosphate pyrophosphohydrolase [Paludibacteraceae bacterium]|nr:nucleoside triphosphate pyrophosphohydrolase [Paludibacteraceae bacterium]